MRDTDRISTLPVNFRKQRSALAKPIAWASLDRAHGQDATPIVVFPACGPGRVGGGFPPCKFRRLAAPPSATPYRICLACLVAPKDVATPQVYSWSLGAFPVCRRQAARWRELRPATPCGGQHFAQVTFGRSAAICRRGCPRWYGNRDPGRCFPDLVAWPPQDDERPPEGGLVAFEPDFGGCGGRI